VDDRATINLVDVFSNAITRADITLLLSLMGKEWRGKTDERAYEFRMSYPTLPTRWSRTDALTRNNYVAAPWGIESPSFQPLLFLAGMEAAYRSSGLMKYGSTNVDDGGDGGDGGNE
jgi:hypothetical protein